MRSCGASSLRRRDSRVSLVTDPDNHNRQRVLFLCTHNSARSQMAEGILRDIAGDRFIVESAGTEATQVRPEAVRAMDKLGIDIRAHTSKTLQRALREDWEYVITVCDQANESCPYFPGSQNRLHWSFEDPSSFQGAAEERQVVFDRTARMIQARIKAWLEELPASADTPARQGPNKRGDNIEA